MSETTEQEPLHWYSVPDDGWRINRHMTRLLGSACTSVTLEVYQEYREKEGDFPRGWKVSCGRGGGRDWDDLGVIVWYSPAISICYPDMGDLVTDLEDAKAIAVQNFLNHSRYMLASLDNLPEAKRQFYPFVVPEGYVVKDKRSIPDHLKSFALPATRRTVPTIYWCTKSAEHTQTWTGAFVPELTKENGLGFELYTDILVIPVSSRNPKMYELTKI